MPARGRGTDRFHSRLAAPHPRLAEEPISASIDIQAVYERHVNTVYRVCYGFMKNAADTEDATQETFIRLVRAAAKDAASVRFESEEHEKAWLIRVASNVCKDQLKLKRRTEVPLEDAAEPAAPAETYDATLDVVLGLDPKYKDVVYLYYYEGYGTAEIAGILGKTQVAVQKLLAQARGILKQQLGGDWE